MSKHHRYLTLVTDHATGKIVWGAEGKDTATLDAFFDDLGSEKAAALQAVSMDMGPASATSVTAPGHAPPGRHLHRPVPRRQARRRRTGRPATPDLE